MSFVSVLRSCSFVSAEQDGREVCNILSYKLDAEKSLVEGRNRELDLHEGTTWRLAPVVMTRCFPPRFVVASAFSSMYLLVAFFQTRDSRSVSASMHQN